MSNFNCEKCGTYLIDSPGGGYVTECEHYPKEPSIKSRMRKKHGILIENQPKTSKNFVSYFYAGCKAGLVISGNYTPEQIEELDYTTTSFKNTALPTYHAYLDGKYDEDGLESMYNQLKKSDLEFPISEKVAEQTGLIEWEKGFRTRYGHLIWKYEDSIANHFQSLLLRQAEKTRKETIEKIIGIVKSEYLFLGAPDGYYVRLNRVMEILESLKSTKDG